MAEFEKDIIKERVIAGLANAHRKGEMAVDARPRLVQTDVVLAKAKELIEAATQETSASSVIGKGWPITTVAVSSSSIEEATASVKGKKKPPKDSEPEP